VFLVYQHGQSRGKGKKQEGGVLDPTLLMISWAERGKGGEKVHRKRSRAINFSRMMPPKKMGVEKRSGGAAADID